MLIRGRSAWMRDYLQRAYAQTDLMYHIWWDNAAMIRLLETHPADNAKIETCRSHWLFNSYVFGPRDSADDAGTRLYKPGDFLIHFAGVYDMWNIYRMMLYAQRCSEKRIDMDTRILDMWRKSPPANKAAADASLLAV